ncbi:MAG: peptide ABC transporter substrate-binding protein [Xanthomonadales bacterium]|jgi:oligopeptide transport system substrate-binding protein|nr:peptide ABC transporter substrate-binding protein [Xanthomonadales bacterium]
MLLLALLWLRVAGAAPILQRGLGPEPDALDPQRAQGLSAQILLRDTHEGLTREDAAGRIVPGAAARWTVSADGRVWQFHLRPGLRWADGQPLTAADYVDTLRRAVDPSSAAPYADSLRLIAGADAVLKRAAAVETLGVEAEGQTVIVHLAAPRLDLPARLALPIAMPHRLDPQGRPIGSGPYRLITQRPHSHLDLARNPHYWNAAAVPIEQVRWHITEDAGIEARRFAAGELHLTQTVPPGRRDQLVARYGKALQIAPAYGTFFIGLNLRRPPFKDALALREALSLAIDRERLVQSITGLGEAPATHLLPPGLGGEPPAWAGWSAAQRLALARQRYAEAGYGPGKPLTLELRFNTSLVHRRTLLAVSLMWEEALGVRTRLRNEEWKVFVATRRAGVVTQAFRGGWNADLADPLDFLQLYESQSGLNYTGYADAEYDRQVDTARHALDPAERQAAVRAAEARLLQAHALIPLYFYTTRRLVSPLLEPPLLNPLDRQSSASLRFREVAP